jgi:hypothetical protein
MVSTLLAKARYGNPRLPVSSLTLLTLFTLPPASGNEVAPVTEDEAGEIDPARLMGLLGISAGDDAGEAWEKKTPTSDL